MSLSAAGPLLLVVSVAARLAWTYLAPNGANFVDLHVYIGGGAAIDHPGALYRYVYADQTPDFPLPFTYPPFAAVVFYPLHLLPFGLVAFCWQVGTMVALYGVVRLSQRLLGVPAGSGHRIGMAWTAIGIWTEPLRSTFDYGQINVLLTLAGLWAAYSTRWWLSGLLVGLAAGVKLTPAITGFYFVGMRRWAAALFSAVVFAATVAVSALIVSNETRFYFTKLVRDTNRVGPICTTFNQSWRGGICRIFGHDPGYSPVVMVALAVTAVLATLAWRALKSVGAQGEAGSAGTLADRRIVRLAGGADLVDPSLGVAAAVDDLADSRTVVGSSRRPHLGLGVAGADFDRCAVAAQLRATQHLAAQPAVVFGLGRNGLHRSDVGDAGLDSGYWRTGGGGVTGTAICHCNTWAAGCRGATAARERRVAQFRGSSLRRLRG